MKRIAIFTVVALTCLGCGNQYHYQVDQALLLQENQRLENALYVTHAQLSDVKQENETLKTSLAQKRAESSDDDMPTLAPPSRKKSADSQRNDIDDAPPFSPPKVSVPDKAPGTEKIPDSLKVPLKTPLPGEGLRTATKIPVVELTQENAKPSPPPFYPATPDKASKTSPSPPQLNPPKTESNGSTIPAWTPSR